MKKILIVDDDSDLCKLLQSYLTRKGFDAEITFKGKSAIELLKKDAFDLVLSDFRLPDMDGIELLQHIKKVNNAIQVIIITGYSDIKIAVNAIKYGAYDYVTKPIHPEIILEGINSALESKKSVSPSQTKAVKSETTVKPKVTSPSDSYQFVEGAGVYAKKLMTDINLISPTDMSVIIQGESGTGKEYVARMIHNKSERKNEPFVAIDCGALPDTLASSELFGHKKGAFTGALTDKQGQFETANGGTLFLDEIGNLSYENQVKLLRAIQERKVRRVGDTKDINVNIRIIVATNDNLRDAVREGKFREDLFFRLNEFTIELAPLRERKEDIKVFSDYFRELANGSLNKQSPGFTDEVNSKLQEHQWPGNLRELKNVIKRAVLLANNDVININCLPEEICNPQFFDHQNGTSFNELPDNITDLKTVAEEAERNAIIKVLKQNNFNKSKTAKQLNVDRKTLYNKMNAYGLLEPNV